MLFAHLLPLLLLNQHNNSKISAVAGCEYGDLTPRCQTVRDRKHLCYLPENQRLCCVTCPSLEDRQSPGNYITQKYCEYQNTLHISTLNPFNFDKQLAKKYCLDSSSVCYDKSLPVSPETIQI